MQNSAFWLKTDKTFYLGLGWKASSRLWLHSHLKFGLTHALKGRITCLNEYALETWLYLSKSRSLIFENVADPLLWSAWSLVEQHHLQWGADLRSSHLAFVEYNGILLNIFSFNAFIIEDSITHILNNMGYIVNDVIIPPAVRKMFMNTSTNAESMASFILKGRYLENQTS